MLKGRTSSFNGKGTLGETSGGADPRAQNIDLDVLKADMASVDAELLSTDTIAGNSAELEGEHVNEVPMSLLNSRVALLAVASTYGTLGVICRYLFLQPEPLSVSMLSLIRVSMAAIIFLPVLWRSLPWSRTTRASGRPPAVTRPGFWLAVLDLAVCNASGMALVNFGLLYTDATHVSFLLQTSVCMVPILSFITKEEVPWSTWLACLICFCGVVLLSVDFHVLMSALSPAGGFSHLGDSLKLGKGDFLCLASAFSFALYTFRNSVYAKRGFPASSLQAWKTVILCLFYSIWLGFDLFNLPGGGHGVGQLALLWPGWRDVGAWMLLGFSALIPGAWADTMQAKSQAAMPASEAAIILATDPLWTALFASIFLHEILTLGSWFGGGLIVCAGLVAVIRPSKQKSS
eukprot:CAMPEP_0196591956 /NCGR_PEP_ID=MMETSP1081-20130531/71393_1 /TAXON_ID=36882 /ORGANISM="Pyramimonas amylifera, Strain CCMP720" /LENGTH=403 /DNA_ID=CAMNT_0041915501 /DNA_START=277 /DNA_END=1488 /DNA_ORIENTATION=+